MYYYSFIHIPTYYAQPIYNIMFLHNIMYRENGENARQDAIARKNSKKTVREDDDDDGYMTVLKNVS